MFWLLRIFGFSVISYLVSVRRVRFVAGDYPTVLFEILAYFAPNGCVILLCGLLSKILEVVNDIPETVIFSGLITLLLPPLCSVLFGMAAASLRFRLAIYVRRRKAADNRGKSRRMSVSVASILLHVVAFLLFFLIFTYLWARGNYGNTDMDAILFTLNMPLQGTADMLIQSYLLRAMLPAILMYMLLFVVVHAPFTLFYWLEISKSGGFRRHVLLFPPRHGRKTCAIMMSAAFLALLLCADYSFGLGSWFVNQFRVSTLIEEEYVSPANVSLTFPEEKRNLIWIYLESAETSSQDRENGGLLDYNCIPELTQIAKDNVSFSQSELLEGAAVAPACGWTMAALTAQTAGLPLKLYTSTDTSVDNSMDDYEYFLPGAVTLGDILEENGYHNVFMAGSDFEFGGRANYFTQHGNYEILDYVWAQETGRIDEDYYVWWGFEDEKLYTFAKEKLLELASEDEPFNFSMLTVDTHHPDGYACELCGDTYEEQYANVWACASAQAADFVAWIQKQDFYENTTIIITGDHCSMDVDFYGEYAYDRHIGETVRRVYNAFLNTAELEGGALDAEKNREFTTLDFFPTALAAIGVEIEGERLGLGTNLFSGVETLAEEYGYEYLFAELNRKSVFYNKKLLYP